MLLQTNHKEQKEQRGCVTAQFASLHKLMCTNPGQETVAKFYEVKLKLEQISMHKTEGAMTRGKARWCEQGERSTRYFFNLEKRNCCNNYITKLKAENRTLVTPTEILNEEHRYYQNLYTSTCTNPNDTCFDEFFESPTLPKLTTQVADTCDGFLTKEECYASLKEFSRGKSPGTDGLTAEFYLKFWELLGQELVDSLNDALEIAKLSILQKRGIITLIPKKDKNKVFLNNWRPISLLHTDYKIATKAIAARIAKVLPSLIHGDQTGYIKGCFIGQNVHLMADITECMDTLDI